MKNWQVALFVLLFAFATLNIVKSLECGEVICPGNSTSCNIKYKSLSYTSKKVLNTVECFDYYKRKIYSSSYESDSNHTLPDLPQVECGGYKCKTGAFNCTSLMTPNLKSKPPKETTHLVCRDEKGFIIEEKDIVRVLSETEASGTIPPTCEGHKCPQGSRSCTYDTVINLEPYNRTTHVTCYDIKSC